MYVQTFDFVFGAQTSSLRALDARSPLSIRRCPRGALGALEHAHPRAGLDRAGAGGQRAALGAVEPGVLQGDPAGKTFAAGAWIRITMFLLCYSAAFEVFFFTIP